MITNSIKRGLTVLCLLSAAGAADAQCISSQTLVAGDPQSGAIFGSCAAIGGKNAIVGAPFKATAAGTQAGEVYFFHDFGGLWDQSGHLFPNNPQAFDKFGTSVGIDASAQYAVVGAPGVSSSRGAVYFLNLDLGTVTWVQTGEQFIAGGLVNDQFGKVVAISPDSSRAIAGAPNRKITANGITTNGEGEALVYRRVGNTYVFDGELFQPDPSLRNTNDIYGAAVAIDGDLAAVGCPAGDGAGTPDSGYFDIWGRDSFGEWGVQVHYFASDRQSGDYLGTSVAVGGDYVAAGAPGAAVNGMSSAGAVYLEYYDGMQWVNGGKLTATDASVGAQFGPHVSMSGARMAVAAPGAHKTYLFKRVGPGQWVQDARINGPIGSDTGFACDASISGSTVIAGDWSYDVGANNAAGASYILSAPTSGSDACEGATPVAAGAYQSCTYYATVDGSSSCGGGVNFGPDIWFSYTAPCSGSVTINTGGSSFDTVLSVHSGCPGTPANVVACNDDVNYPTVRTSTVKFYTTAGHTYLIRVAGYNTASGDVVLNVGTCKTCPADFNESGSITVQDLFDFLTAWFAKCDGEPAFCSGRNADFNGSGQITVQDLFDYLTAWFAKGCP